MQVITSGGVLGRSKWLYCVIFISSCGLLTVAAAQEQFDPQWLIFDSVPLSAPIDKPVDAVSAADVPPYIAQELQSLPNTNPQSVMQVLVALRGPKPALTGPDASNDIARYEAMLKTQEQAGNAYALSLRETLLALAAVHEQQGNYKAATPLYARALHLSRVNDGLFNLQQEELIQRQFNNYYQQGDLVAADEQQRYWFYVAKKVYGETSAALIPILKKYADWNLRIGRPDFLLLPAPEEPTIADANADAEQAPAIPDLLMFQIDHLAKAQVAYSQLRDLLEQHGETAQVRLATIEYLLAVSNYWYTARILRAQEMTGDSAIYMPLTSIPFGYYEGLKVLRQRVKRLQQNSTTSAEVIGRAYMDIADWLVLTLSRGELSELYEEALVAMQRAGATEQEIQSVFDPVFPQVVPAFSPPYYSRAALEVPATAALAYKGYIDLSFAVNSLGDTSTPAVLFKTPGTPEAVQRILLREVRRAQFLPRYRNGKFVVPDKLYVRYYYTY
jgi:hypothetical protein